MGYLKEVKQFKEQMGDSASQKTYAHTCSALGRFLLTLPKDEEELPLTFLDDYVKFLIDEEKTGATIVNYLTVSRKYLKWRVRNELMTSIELERIEEHYQDMGTKVDSSDRRQIDRSEIATMIKNVEPFYVPSFGSDNAEGAMVQLRTRALIFLFAFTGIRVSEAVSLNKELFNQYFNKWDGIKPMPLRLKAKGRGKYRTVPVIPQALFAIRQWLEARHTYFDVDLDSADIYPPLFVSVSRRGKKSGNRRLSRQTIHNDISTLAADYGLSSYISPHALRHYYAEMLAVSGSGLAKVADAIGDSVEVTHKYYMKETGLDELAQGAQKVADSTDSAANGDS